MAKSKEPGTGKGFAVYHSDNGKFMAADYAWTSRIGEAYLYPSRSAAQEVATIKGGKGGPAIPVSVTITADLSDLPADETVTPADSAAPAGGDEAEPAATGQPDTKGPGE